MPVQCRPGARNFRPEAAVPDRKFKARAVQLLPLAALTIFLACNIFDMGGEHHYKYIGFILIVPVVLLGIPRVRFGLPEIVVGILLFLLWPLAGIGIGLENDAKLGDAVQQTTPFCGLFIGVLVAMVVRPRIILNCLYFILLFMAFSVVVMTVCHFFHFGDAFVLQLPDYVSSHVDPYIGTFQRGELSDRIYFTATLWLVPVAIYFAQIRRYAFSICCLLGLVFAVSKAGALIGLIGMVGTIALQYKRRSGEDSRLRRAGNRVRGVVLLLSGLVLASLVFPDFRYDVLEAFFGNDAAATRDTRFGHVRALIDMVRDKPSVMFVGEGAGTTFYSSETGQYGIRMESDHVDAIRQHGIFWSLAFFALCGLIAWKLTRAAEPETRATGWAFIGMFIAAGTNPQLITPLFFFYFGCCYVLATYGDELEGHAARHRGRSAPLSS